MYPSEELTNVFHFVALSVFSLCVCAYLPVRSFYWLHCIRVSAFEVLTGNFYRTEELCSFARLANVAYYRLVGDRWASSTATRNVPNNFGINIRPQCVEVTAIHVGTVTHLLD